MSSDNYPYEYEECKAFLLNYRKELLEKLVLGRLRALASEYVNTIERIRNIVENFPIDFALKGMIQRYYLVGITHNKTLNGFSELSAKLSYVGKTSLYPKESPQTEVKELPSVPMIIYEPLKEYELHEKIGESITGVWAIIRSSAGTFKETPDFANAFYEYYRFTERKIETGEWNVYDSQPFYVNGREVMITKVRGQCHTLKRTLTRASDNVSFTIMARIFIDVTLYWSDGTQHAESIAIQLSCDPMPETHLCDVMVCNRLLRIPEDIGFWESLRYQDRMFGIRKVGRSIYFTY